MCFAQYVMNIYIRPLFENEATEVHEERVFQFSLRKIFISNIYYIIAKTESFPCLVFNIQKRIFCF